MNWWIVGCLGGGLLLFLAVVGTAIVLVGSLSKQLGLSPSQQTPSAKLPLGSLTTAPGFVGLPGQTQYLDLDTQDSHNSSWRHAELGSASALYADFRVLRLGGSQLSPPQFWLSVRGEPLPRSSRRWAGLSLAFDRNGGPLVADIFRIGDRGPVEQHRVHAHIDLNQPVGVTIDWHTPRVVVITLSDGETQRLQFPWKVSSVEVGSSDGELEVNPLVLGTMQR